MEMTNRNDNKFPVTSIFPDVKEIEPRAGQYWRYSQLPSPE